MRACSSCTACCEGWLKIDVNDESIYPGRPCSACGQGKGCRIYEHRPMEPCQSFLCGWRQKDSPLPDWFRPDKSKAIVLLNKLTWRGYPVDVVVPVGNRIPKRALNWLKQFSNQTQRPLLYMEQKMSSDLNNLDHNVVGYGPTQFLEDVQNVVKQGKPLW